MDDREIRVEINRIWDELRRQDRDSIGVAVLQVQVGNVLQELAAMRVNRKWLITQTIVLLGIGIGFIGVWIGK